MDTLRPYLEFMNRWGKAKVKRPRTRAPGPEAWPDVTLRYDTPAGPIEYAVELRAHFKHEDANWILGRLDMLRGRGTRALLLAPGTTETQREVLRKGDVDYVDLAGNVHLKRPGFLVHIEGRRAPAPVYPQPEMIYKRAGLQVLYVLLAIPEAVTWPYRPLAEAAGVALRTANYVVRGLRDEGFIAGEGKRKTIQRRGDLIARWVEAYRADLRPRLLLGGFRTRPRPRPKLLGDMRAYFTGRGLPWAVTGGEAAFKLTHHYRGEHLVVFAGEDLAGLDEQVGCMPDPKGDLQLLRYFCEAVAAPQNKRRVPLAHPLLVYAELLAEGTERALEAGRLVMEEHLRG